MHVVRHHHDAVFSMGTGMVFGMTIATAIGLFLIPVCYVFAQTVIDRGGTGDRGDARRGHVLMVEI